MHTPAMLRIAALVLAASASATTDHSVMATRRLRAAVQLSTCTVSLGSNATASEHFAAEELSIIGGNMSGGEPLPIHRGEADMSASCTIAVGYSAAVAAGVPLSQLAESKLGFEGYVVTALGASVWAATGADGAPRGAVFAVYELLEWMGWMQLAWDAELMPTKPPQMPAAISVTQSGPPSGVVWREVDDW
jgi:hypothetical protein